MVTKKKTIKKTTKAKPKTVGKYSIFGGTDEFGRTKKQQIEQKISHEIYPLYKKAERFAKKHHLAEKMTGTYKSGEI
jgi:hypothetical protein